MKDLIKTLFLIAIVIAAISTSHGFGYHRLAEIARQPSQSDCDKMREVFKEVLLSHKAPGGLVILYGSNCGDLSPFIERTSRADPIGDRLNILVDLVPGFTWLDQNGVLNLEPAMPRAGILDTRIGSFAYCNSSNLDIILDSLKRTPEVLSEMEKIGIREGLNFGGLHSPPSKKVSTEVVLHNKTVREILNDIVRRRGRGLWVYSERIYDNSLTFTLNFVIK